MTSTAGRVRRLCDSVGVNLTADTEAVIEGYIRLLTAWNARMNLTALDIEGPSDSDLARLVVEPMAASRHIQADARKVIDLGSGGGSPAIPLKAICPHLAMTMVESRTRKAVFLKETVRALALKDAEVIDARFEAVAMRPEFSGAADVVTVRAVRVDDNLVSSAATLLRPGGTLLLFSGDIAGLDDELEPLFDRVGSHDLLPSSTTPLVVLRRGNRSMFSDNVPRGTS